MNTLKVNAFLQLLNLASFVYLNGEFQPCTLQVGSWTVAAIKGEPENEVVRFSWTDRRSEGDVDQQSQVYSLMLSEESISQGVWEGSVFTCIDSEGEILEVKVLAWANPEIMAAITPYLK